MKTIKINNIEVSAEELRRVIKENPDILKDEVKGRYFFPKEGELYWIVYHNNGEIISISIRNDNTIFDKHFISTGNCYRTEAEAQLALDKQKAIVACWKWASENAPFEPDWKDIRQYKWSVYYNTKDKCLETTWDVHYQTNITLPYFKSEKDAQAFINANKDNLMLLFTK